MSGIILLVLRSILTICLYVFLGWAIWVLWRDLRHQNKIIRSQQVTPLKFNLQIGDEQQLEEFSHSEITVGRDPRSECVINSKTVSSFHARLSFHHKQWWLEDLDSTNGTLLNQEKVSTPTVVAPGDTIQCGEAILTIQKSGHAP
jgi:hypothetical protein